MEDTRTIPILDRQVEVRKMTGTQVMLLGREATRLARGNLDGRDALRSTSRILDLLEQTLVKSEDQEWLVDQMTEGKIEMEDLMGTLTAFDEPAPKTGPVRRGRPVRK
jgi:hypothetical protein